MGGIGRLKRKLDSGKETRKLKQAVRRHAEAQANYSRNLKAEVSSEADKILENIQKQIDIIKK